MRFFLIAFVALYGAAFAQPAQAPGSEQAVSRAQDYIRSNREALDAVIRSAAVQMAAQAASPAPAASVAPAATPTVTVTAPIPTVTVTAPTTVTIPAEIRDAIVSLCGILITAGIAAGLAWMRSHFAFMKEVEINATITSSAEALGGLLEQALAKQGKSLSSVDISDPIVAATAQKLLAAYPEWGPIVGLTQDIAERKVLGSAIVQSTAPIVPAPTVTVVVPPEPPPIVETLKPGDIA